MRLLRQTSLPLSMNKYTIWAKDTSSITGGAIPREFIHPTSGKRNSAKVVSAILNSLVHEGGVMRLSTALRDRSQHYIL